MNLIIHGKIFLFGSGIFIKSFIKIYFPMKRQLLLFCLLIIFSILLISLDSYGQLFSRKSNANEKLKSELEEKLDFLSYDKSYISKYFDIQKDHIIVKYGDDQVEHVLYFDEIPYFLNLFDSLNMYEIQEFYLGKRKRLPDSLLNVSKIEKPAGAKIKISLDPGHFASNKQESIYEDRYVKFKFDSATDDTFINEASLNYDIALMLEKMLIASGHYEVKITRGFGKSAVGQQFDSWLEDKYIYDIRNLLANEELTLGRASVLLKAKDEETLFKEVYTYIDFRERVKVINAFNPDLSLVIHLNAYEFGGRDENGYSKLTDENYSMVFVPGSFLMGELEKVDQRIDFLRLLVSDNIEKSIKAADILSNVISTELDVPRFDNTNYKSNNFEFYTKPTAHQGVFSRNLYMCRAIESPVIYGETLLQDNVNELKMLSEVDYFEGNIRTSKRAKQIANTYFIAINKYFNL